MNESQRAPERGARASRRRVLLGCAVVGLEVLIAGCAPASQPSRTPTPAVGTTPTTGPAPVAPVSPTRAVPPTAEPSPTPIPPSPTPVPRTVTLWTAEASPVVVKAIELAGSAFSAKHSGLNVKVVGGQSDYGKIIQSLALTLGPDLLDPGALAPYATRGVLRALDGFLGAGSISASNYPAAMWQSGQWSGKTYGVPALDNGPQLGFLVNRSLTTGDVSTIDSWDKLFSFGLAATKKNSQGIQILGWDPLNGTGGLLQTVESITGQSWFDPSTKQITLNNPTYQSYLDHLKSFYQTIGLDALNAFRSLFSATTTASSSGIDHETEAAVVGDYRLAARLSAKVQAHVVANWVPASSGAKVQRLGGRFLAIPTVAARPDDSWLLLSYLAGDDGNGLLFNEAGRGVWTNSFESSRPWGKNQLLSFYGDSLSQATSLGGQPIDLLAGVAQIQWQIATRTAIQGTASSADALKAAQSMLEAERQRLTKAQSTAG